MTDNTIHDDPAAIEQDIRRTQQDMSRTVDQIGNQLTAKNLFNALLDKADENGVDAHYLIDGARRNPLALGLIAAGAIWLVSDKDSKIPSMPSRGKKPQAGTDDELDLTGHDIHHRDYVAHMSSFETREDEEPASYQRRRDLHRANFLMCERRPDEDDHGFRQRLDDMTESFRQKRRAWSDSASSAGSATKQRTQHLASQASGRTQELASQASTKVQDFYSTSPLVGGILAAAVGAALGSTVPISRTEQEKLGAIGGKARDLASEQKDQIASQVSDKKDELLDKADQKLQPNDQQQSQRQPEPAFQSAGASQSTGEQRSTSEGPFIISERNL
jgi:hypothetical protein